MSTSPKSLSASSPGRVGSRYFPCGRSPRLGRYILVLAGILALSASACKAGDDVSASAGRGPGGMQSDNAVLVEAVKAESGVPFAVQGDYAGEFVADRMAEVAFEVSGRVVTLNHEIGDQIKKGDVMAAIDQTAYRQRVREASAAVKMAQASVGEAEVALENLEADMARRRPLLKKQLVSEREIEDLDAQLRQASQKVLVAQASLEQSRARLQTAQEDLRNTEVRAPFDARVAARNVDLGSYVGPNQPAFSLVSDSGLYLRINIPEQDAAHIAEGKPVTVRVGALGGNKFEGHVERVAPAIDRTTRMMRTDIALHTASENENDKNDKDDKKDSKQANLEPDNGEDAEIELETLRRLRPGMYAHVQVELGRRDDAVTVPRQVLLEERSRAPFVWTVVDGLAKQQQVILGLQGRERVEVVNGLNGGELVVIRGSDGLTEGAKVRLLATGATDGVTSEGQGAVGSEGAEQGAKDKEDSQESSEQGESK